MSEKVWIINDEDICSKGRKPAFKDHTANSQLGRSKSRLDERQPEIVEPPQKNPALSFSLAMIVCGGGHIYLGLHRLGIVLALFKILVVLLLVSIFLQWNSVRSLSVQYYAEMPLFIFAVMVFVLTGLVLWLGGAIDAYHRTIKVINESDNGVNRDILPLLANLIFPGWGQFLNGQPRKGSLYLFIGVVGLFSLFVLLAARPFWEIIVFSPVSRAFELILLATVIFFPAALLVWIISIYDIYRTRIGSSLTTPLPRSSAVFALLLAISLGMQLIPDQYYLHHLESARQEMMQYHMTVLPEVFGAVLRLLR